MRVTGTCAGWTHRCTLLPFGKGERSFHPRCGQRSCLANLSAGWVACLLMNAGTGGSRLASLEQSIKGFLLSNNQYSNLYKKKFVTRFHRVTRCLSLYEIETDIVKCRACCTAAHSYIRHLLINSFCSVAAQSRAARPAAGRVAVRRSLGGQWPHVGRHNNASGETRMPSSSA